MADEWSFGSDIVKVLGAGAVGWLLHAAKGGMGVKNFGMPCIGSLPTIKSHCPRIMAYTIHVWRRPSRPSTNMVYCVHSNPYRLRIGRKSPSRSPTKGISLATIRYWHLPRSGQEPLAMTSASTKSDVRCP